MFEGKRVALIIPALDEATTIGEVIAAVDRQLVDDLIVADNGSSDQTAQIASAAGADVVVARRRGYGSACLAGIARARQHGAELFAFLDADGSDDPRELGLLFELLAARSLDLVIGSRVLGTAERGALTPVQRFGNALTCTLVRIFWGVRFTDLGPLRVITGPALDALEMVDPDFGWTIEMQVKSAQRGLRVAETAVSYRNRRGGRSKVSGSLRGSYLAGRKILGYVFAAKFREFAGR
ncbi:MAG: glycosyltransferase family 2 protein [Deltaproteobacteria bacterium]|nr:glycosyltransferase family 2 protein [Deltaproteobacteria bacterium]